ncbi:MAG: hypothetical protein ABL949_13035 [Fimbriimonadaceae bacterium]
MKTNLTLLVLITIFSLGGCVGKESTTVVNADGSKSTVTSNPSDGSVKIEGNGTSASIGGGTTVTEADLGIPFYPGSTEKPNASMKVDTPTEKSYMCTRTTADEVSKVAEFYEGKVKGLKFNTFSANDTTTTMASMTQENGAKIAVSATRKKSESETTITLAYGLETKK